MKKIFQKRFSLLFLVLLSCFAKLVGALYRIPLTNVLGAEGIGLYQLVFPLYAFCVTIVSGALPVAVSSSVAKCECEEDKERIALSYALFFALGALVLFILLALLAGYVAYLLGNEGASIALIMLAPSLPFCAVSASIRGYFQGKKNMMPFGVSQIIEQIAKVAFGLVLAYLLLGRGVVVAVGGATLGITVAELIVAVVMLVLFFRKRKTKAKPSFKLFVAQSKRVFPVLAGVLVLPLSQLVDSALIVNLLSPFIGVQTATAQYGLLTGPVASLVNLPSVIIASVSAWLLPIVSEKPDSEKTRKLLTRCAKGVALGSAVYAVSLFIFSPLIIDVLYSALSAWQKDVCINLLKISAVTVFCVSMLRVVTVFLQGVGKFSAPTVDLLFAVAVKTLVTVLAIKPLGIYGCALAQVVGYSVALVADLFALKKELGFDFMIKPAISYGFCFVLYGSVAFSAYSLFSSVWGAIGAFTLGVLVLLAYLQAFRLVDVVFVVRRYVSEIFTLKHRKNER